MRIVLFYSGVESFNYFSNQLAEEFTKRGHDVFLLDMSDPVPEDPHSFTNFNLFLHKQVDLAIAFDGLGIKEDVLVDIWNEFDVTTVDILMDHPLRFQSTFEHHANKYVLFCCDENHVQFVKKYWSIQVPHVFFLPHAGTLPAKNSSFLPLKDRPYDILFSGTYYKPESYLAEIDSTFSPDSTLNQLFRVMANRLLEDTTLTTEDAVTSTLEQYQYPVQESQLKTMFRCAIPIDWMVRMYQRERVITTLADSGLDVWLLGRGWENHPCASYPNVHRIDDRIPFADTFSYMANAKINLNVMPWFKAGTHDRIFNTLLQHSLPLTDTSSWIDHNFKDNENIALYDLNHMEEIPFLIQELFSDFSHMEQMIESGYSLVSNKFVWKNCVDQILEHIDLK